MTSRSACATPTVAGTRPWMRCERSLRPGRHSSRNRNGAPRHRRARVRASHPAEAPDRLVGGRDDSRAIFGRKAIGVGSLGRATAARAVGRSMKESDDIRRATGPRRHRRAGARARGRSGAGKRSGSPRSSTPPVPSRRLTHAEARAGLGPARGAPGGFPRALAPGNRAMAPDGKKRQPDEYSDRARNATCPVAPPPAHKSRCAERDALHQRRHQPLHHPSPGRASATRAR